MAAIFHFERADLNNQHSAAFFDDAVHLHLEAATDVLSVDSKDFLPLLEPSLEPLVSYGGDRHAVAGRVAGERHTERSPLFRGPHPVIELCDLQELVDRHLAVVVRVHLGKQFLSGIVKFFLPTQRLLQQGCWDAIVLCISLYLVARDPPLYFFIQMENIGPAKCVLLRQAAVAVGFGKRVELWVREGRALI